jgi:hypothetical protein
MSKNSWCDVLRTSAYRKVGLPSPFVVVTELRPVETGSILVDVFVNDRIEGKL